MKKIMCAMLFSALSVSVQAAQLSGKDKSYVNELRKELVASQCSVMTKEAQVYSANTQQYGRVSVVVVPAEGCGGGNNWATFFKVFYNDGKSSTESSAVPMVDSVKIKENVITLSSTTYAEDDPRCCPSLHEETKYKFNGNKLTALRK